MPLVYRILLSTSRKMNETSVQLVFSAVKKIIPYATLFKTYSDIIIFQERDRVLMNSNYTV